MVVLDFYYRFDELVLTMLDYGDELNLAVFGFKLVKLVRKVLP
jgi:hypothetical protein